MPIWIRLIEWNWILQVGCDTFSPKRIWSPDIWSSTVGPQLIGPSGQTVPNQFGPHGQMVPKNLVPMDKWSPANLVPLDKWSIEYSVCPGGQAVGIRKYGNRIGCGLFVQGDQILGDHLSMGTEFVGDHFLQGDRFYGDCLSMGTGSRGPEVRGSNGFGTKCVAAASVTGKIRR